MGAIAGQPAARVGEVIGIAPEDDALGSRWRRNGADLRSAGRRAAGRLQSGCSRQRIRAERLPAVGTPSFDDQHETVVRHDVVIQVRQQKAAIPCVVDELVDRHDAAVVQCPCAFPVLTADIGPPDEVRPVFAHIGDCHREPLAEFTVEAK